MLDPDIKATAMRLILAGEDAAYIANLVGFKVGTIEYWKSAHRRGYFVIHDDGSTSRRYGKPPPVPVPVPSSESIERAKPGLGGTAYDFDAWVSMPGKDSFRAPVPRKRVGQGALAASQASADD